MKKAIEALRYSDPMSNEKTFALDNQIVDLIRHIQESDSVVRKELCQELLLLLKERNAILKTSK